ncbi:hypothetical protein BDW66DRAFT_139078 [Aspergillus desertorum]
MGCSLALDSAANQRIKSLTELCRLCCSIHILFCIVLMGHHLLCGVLTPKNDSSSRYFVRLRVTGSIASTSYTPYGPRNLGSFKQGSQSTLEEQTGK